MTHHITPSYYQRVSKFVLKSVVEIKPTVRTTVVPNVVQLDRDLHQQIYSAPITNQNIGALQKFKLHELKHAQKQIKDVKSYTKVV